MFRSLFVPRPWTDILAAARSTDQTLRRALGAFNITLLGVGAAIGAGIFATIGTAAAGDAARPGAGPSLMLSFAITATVLRVYSALLRGIRIDGALSGSAYTYAFTRRSVSWSPGSSGGT